MRTWGHGDRTALLVHGLFSDSASWHRLGPDLADDGFKVYAPDLRGHGQSPRGRYSPTDWALDLVESYGDTRLDLAVGHSLGGMALAIAAKTLRPASAIYLDPAWQMSAADDSRSRAQWNSWLLWTDQAQLRETLGPKWPEADLQLRWESMWRMDPATIPGLASGAGYDHSPEDAAVPTLVLGADGSSYITPEHAAELRTRGLDVETIEGSGHSSFREDYPAFLNRLRDWVAAHS
ncbi:alpha/beta fold hydrolase [Nocardioides immobilis]|uniref:Alpha/beta fold hydrolase n=1 Tax=Nocardioides immobilis TaxID=2049295 RepID=A0A417Y8Y3_9ACTN|nr:alpha/beta fold hydrolase [Nocardioides immobilis]RHW29183.1 alpha/beta fold hydrolase [Nocardioides immobilis]